MREKEVPESKPTETRDESAETGEAGESKKRDEKRRTFDTLNDDNPLICRGMD